MKIGELSRRTQVSTDALRLYEKRGLIRSERLANGYRDFDDATVRFVGLIRLGQRLGFKLNEMKDIVLVLSDQDLGQDEMADMLQSKLDEVDAKISELSDLKKLLTELVAQACPLRA